jgi:hydrogenase maturation protease
MTHVLGLGNALMGDDGFGPAVIRAFEAEYAVGADVDVIDLGTPGLDVTPWLVDVDRVIVVDTVNTGEAPGTIRFFDKEELLRHAPGIRVGPHDPGLIETLFTLEFAGRGPKEVILIGVVPGSVEMGLDLTPCVRDMVPAAVELLARALTGLGTTIVHRERPVLQHPWWAVSPSTITFN